MVKNLMWISANLQPEEKRSYTSQDQALMETVLIEHTSKRVALWVIKTSKRLRRHKKTRRTWKL
jgi:hypothetical protein